MSNAEIPLFAIDSRKNGLALSIDSPLGKSGEILTGGQFLQRYASLPLAADRVHISSQFLQSTIQSPLELLSFFKVMSASPELRDKSFLNSFGVFTKETFESIKTIPTEVTDELVQDTNRLGVFLNIFSFDAKLKSNENTIHKSMNSLDASLLSPLKKFSRELLKTTFENCTTQKQIVEVMYNSSVALLQEDSNENRELLYDILTFSSPYLKMSDPRAGRYVASELSSNEDIFMKYYWLNTTIGALITLLRNEHQRQVFNKRGSEIIKSNPGFAEILQDKNLIISLEQAQLYQREETQTQETNWHTKLSEGIAQTEQDEFNEYLVPPQFPYSI